MEIINLNKLILCLSILTVIGFDRIGAITRNERIKNLQRKEYLKKHVHHGGTQSAPIIDLYFKQKLDHFDDSNDSTFMQV